MRICFPEDEVRLQPASYLVLRNPALYCLILVSQSIRCSLPWLDYILRGKGPRSYGSGGSLNPSFLHIFINSKNAQRSSKILGLTPMNQFDLVASPMKPLFVDNPSADNFKPWTHVPNQIALTTGVNQTPTQHIPSAPVAAVKAPAIVGETPAVKALRAGWMKKKAQVFAGKYQKPDSEDVDTVNHLTWYEATNFIRPYPGEKTVRRASDFKNAAPTEADGDE